MSSLGGFLPLDGLMRLVGGRSAYSAVAWEPLANSLSSRGKLFGIPWIASPELLAYRRDSLRAAGLKEAQAFSSWTETTRSLRALARRPDCSGNPRLLLPGRRSDGAPDRLSDGVLPWIWAVDGEALVQSKRYPWESDRSVLARGRSPDAVLYLERRFRDEALAYGPEAGEERLTLVRTGSSAIAFATLAPQTKTLGFALVPGATAKDKPRALYAGTSFMVDGCSEHPNETKRLLVFLSRPAIVRDYATALGSSVPARTAALPKGTFGKLAKRVLAVAKNPPEHPHWISGGEKQYALDPCGMGGGIRRIYAEGFSDIFASAAGAPTPPTRSSIAAALRKIDAKANALITSSTTS
jgi:ABC-type glycerol-3-phosphate transport system substrate-binding protein